MIKEKVYIADGGPFDGTIYIYHDHRLVEVYSFGASYHYVFSMTRLEKILGTKLIYIGDL